MAVAKTFTVTGNHTITVATSIQGNGIVEVKSNVDTGEYGIAQKAINNVGDVVFNGARFARSRTVYIMESVLFFDDPVYDVIIMKLYNKEFRLDRFKVNDDGNYEYLVINPNPYQVGIRNTWEESPYKDIPDGQYPVTFAVG